MKKNLLIALWFTLVTTVMFGVLYPLAITGLAQLLFPHRANGQLIEKNGKIVGSRIIGQSFTGQAISVRARPVRGPDTTQLPAVARILGRRTRR